jgi:hypothetical protein
MSQLARRAASKSSEESVWSFRSSKVEDSDDEQEEYVTSDHSERLSEEHSENGKDPMQIISRAFISTAYRRNG